MTILLLFLSIFYVDVVGYFVHKLLHSGRIDYLHRLHMEHHITQYPPHDLRSDTYRTTPQKKILGAGPEWALPIGTIMASTALLMLLFGVSMWSMIVFFGGALAYALFAYSYLHDQFHLIYPLRFMDKLPRGSKIFGYTINRFYDAQHLHDVHHHNMKKNYGIGSYWLDKLFKTYKV